MNDDSYSVFRVGTVLSVQGRVVRIRVDTTKNGSYLAYQGQIVKNVSVGGFVKIVKGFMEIVGKVEGERIERVQSPSSDYSDAKEDIARVLEVSLVGFFDPDATFRHGVRELPLIENETFLLSQDELDQVHRFVLPDDRPLAIGTLPMEGDFDLSVGVDALFSSHIGIFGNTGSGKSHTLASLYHGLFRNYGHLAKFRETARFLIIDFNGEYVNDQSPKEDWSTEVIWADKTEYRLSTRDPEGQALPFPAAAINVPEFWEVLLDATEKTQAPFLRRALNNDYWDDKLASVESVLETAGWMSYHATLDGGYAQDRAHIPRFLEDVQSVLGLQNEDALNAFIAEVRTNLGFHGQNDSFMWGFGSSRKWADRDPAFFRAKFVDGLSTMFTGLPVEDGVVRVGLRFVLQYYNEVFKGFANPEHLGPLIRRLDNRLKSIGRVITVSEDDLLANTLTVVSLRDVSLEMKKVIPLLLCSHLYQEQKLRSPSDRHLNFIVDEAHTILSDASSRETEAWKDYRLETFEEIIKEGRKFGVFMTIASQRPYDISETIVSQLHTYFLHRLINHLDMRAIERAVSYLDALSFEALPILPTGTCIVSGLAVRAPVMVAVDKLEEKYAPNSRTNLLSSRWLSEESDEEATSVSQAVQASQSNA